MAVQKTTYNYDIPLQEMKRMYASQSASIDSIKNTIRTVFSAASLIAALFGGLQVFTAKIAPEWQGLYFLAVVVIILLYIIFIGVCILGLWPVYVYPPLDADWDTLTKTFQNMDEDQAKAMYLSSIIQALDRNTPILKKYVRLERTALIMFPIIVALVLSLAIIPRV